MMRNRRQFGRDEVDEVVENMAIMAADLRTEAGKVVEQRGRMDDLAARLERLAAQLREGGGAST